MHGRCVPGLGEDLRCGGTGGCARSARVDRHVGAVPRSRSRVCRTGGADSARRFPSRARCDPGGPPWPCCQPEGPGSTAQPGGSAARRRRRRPPGSAQHPLQMSAPTQVRDLHRRSGVTSGGPGAATSSPFAPCPCCTLLLSPQPRAGTELPVLFPLSWDSRHQKSRPCPRHAGSFPAPKPFGAPWRVMCRLLCNFPSCLLPRQSNFILFLISDWYDYDPVGVAMTH